MDIKEKEQVNSEEIRYLSPGEASALLFGSFEYSQGDEDLQFDIYEYLHERFPELRIDEGTMEAANQTALKRVSSFIIPKESSQVRMHIDDLDQDILDIGVPRQMQNLKNALNGLKTYEELNIEARLQKILEGMISRDSRFLYGRPRSFNENRRNLSVYDASESPKTDPYASYICDYVIRGVEVKIPEFQQMFADIREQLILSLRSDTMNEAKRSALFEIVAQYDKKHKGRKVTDQLKQLITGDEK